MAGLRLRKRNPVALDTFMFQLELIWFSETWAFLLQQCIFIASKKGKSEELCRSSSSRGSSPLGPKWGLHSTPRTLECHPDMCAEVTEASDKGKRKPVSHASQQKLKKLTAEKRISCYDTGTWSWWKIHPNPPVKLCFISDFPYQHYLHRCIGWSISTASANVEGKHCI